MSAKVLNDSAVSSRLAFASSPLSTVLLILSLSVTSQHPVMPATSPPCWKGTVPGDCGRFLLLLVHRSCRSGKELSCCLFSQAQVSFSQEETSLWCESSPGGSRCICLHCDPFSVLNLCHAPSQRVWCQNDPLGLLTASSKSAPPRNRYCKRPPSVDGYSPVLRVQLPALFGDLQ